MDKAALIAGLTALTLLLNLPFGYLRGRSRKFSFQWILYIHLPVPFVIVLRHMAGISYLFIPLMLAAAVTGQFAGSRLPIKK
ncbi:MAG: hypothetical protein IMF07_00605 [Proteobacteria bacterium]|nr:hypothetical protein [Pseudomonadota bacterium]